MTVPMTPSSSVALEPVETSPAQPERLGDFLVASGVLTAQGLREAKLFDENFGGGVGQAALKLGLARESDIRTALSGFLGIGLLEDAAQAEPQLPDIERAVLRLGLSRSFLVASEALLWISTDNEDEQLNIVQRDPLNPTIGEVVSRHWPGRQVTWLASNVFMDALLSQLAVERSDADESGAESQELSRLRELAEEAPVIEFVNRLFVGAFDQNASDIHVEPTPGGFETRLRVDGVLVSRKTYPRGMFDSVVTRIKILSGMDIAERRLPQDGRQTVRIAGEEVDLRVSSIPSTNGESLVLRLLRKRSSLPDIEGLGLRGDMLQTFERLINLPNGVFLVTGPTGSGKSTTLYRALEALNDGETKILTIEDPVEYDISGIGQVQVHADIGLSFAQGLRAMLRHDPDVIMVGEIRDRETAEVAIQAALTGHMVFSTLHTNSALGAVERLQDLGVEPFLISASLRGVLGQRLLRRVCPHCATPIPASDAVSSVQDYFARELPRFETMIADQFVTAKGCAECGETGYSGRIGVFELVDVQGAQSKDGASLSLSEALEIRRLRSFGFRSMLEDALIKCSHGETTLDEVQRVFGHWHN